MKSFKDPMLRQDAIQRISSLTPGQRALWGTMSVEGMVCHLSDSFDGVMGDRRLSPDSSLLNRTLIKWVALHVPMQWPKGIRTRPEVEQGAGGTPPAEFESDVERLVTTIERFCGAPRRTPHPIFGELNESQWLRWAYLHTDHHLRQFGA